MSVFHQNRHWTLGQARKRISDPFAMTRVPDGQGRRHDQGSSHETESGQAGVEKCELEIHPHEPGNGSTKADDRGQKCEDLNKVIRLLGGSGGEQVEASDHDAASPFDLVHRPFEALRQGLVEGSGS